MTLNCPGHPLHGHEILGAYAVEWSHYSHSPAIRLLVRDPDGQPLSVDCGAGLRLDALGGGSGAIYDAYVLTAPGEVFDRFPIYRRLHDHQVSALARAQWQAY